MAILVTPTNEGDAHTFRNVELLAAKAAAKNGGWHSPNKNRYKLNTNKNNHACKY